MKRAIIGCVLAAALAGLQFAAGAGRRAFTIADLYRVRGVGDLQLSPDGRWLLFTVGSSDLARGRQNSDIYRLDLAGGDCRPLTFTEKSETSPCWSADGRTVYFLSDRDGETQLYAMAAGGGEARRLTSFPPGVADPLPIPGGKEVLFSAAVFPEHGADGEAQRRAADQLAKGPVQAHLADALLYRHWTAYRDFRASHLFVADGGGPVRALTSGPTDFPAYNHGLGRGYDVAPDGGEICVVADVSSDAAHSTNGDLWLVDPAGRREPRNITAANPAFDGDPQYSPDGRWIAFRTQKVPGYEADRFRLALYERSSGRVRVLTEALDNWVDRFQWAPDSRSIYFLLQERGRTPLYRLRLHAGDAEKVLECATIREFRLLPDGSGAVLVRTAVHEPAEVYSYRFSSRRLQRMTFLNQELEREVDLRPAEEAWVTGAGGDRVHLFLVKPHGFDPARKYPLILNIHGGPQMQWADALRGDWQVYPGAGYVVAFANPHGSTGYGQAFTEAISGDWDGQVMEDLRRVSDYLAGLPYVDPERMGAMGWSWGGYAVMWLEGQPHRFKALAAMMGVYDLPGMHGATEELWFPEWDLRGTPWTNPEGYAKPSPSNYVKNFKTPCLVITGERDYRVPYTQSLHFFTGLQMMGVPSRLIVFSNDGHWPSNVKSMPVYYNAHLEWFHRFLGGAAAPWDTEKMIRNDPTVYGPAPAGEKK